MHNFTVALDMDATVYDSHTPWLAWLERVHGIRMNSEQIVEWDWHNYLPCGVRVYDFLSEDGAFFNMKPIKGAVEAISEVHEMGVRQFFISTIAPGSSPNGAHEKVQAVCRDFPYLSTEVLITSGSKDLIKADMLVDDGPHNLENFPALTCKVPYRYNDHIKSEFILSDWSNYPELIREILESKFLDKDGVKLV